MEPVELSFVVPVYNGAASIAAVVRSIQDCFAGRSFEVVLVNDGSEDDSERACLALVERFPRTVVFVHLARNFGEHAAVLAGLSHARGNLVAVLDDDGQNPPSEVLRLLDAIHTGAHDVVYGRYRVKQHSRLRNLGSWLNDRMATRMLGKPRDLYLSSFKVMNRFAVDEVVRYRGAFPYIDGLILRATRNVGQVDVEHLGSASSTYTFAKLVKLWLNMFLNFSMLPLRAVALLGICASAGSLVLMVGIVADKLYFKAGVAMGIPTVLLTIVFFAGVQLVILGTIGEYLGRLFLDHSGSPQFVVRYVRRAEPGGV